MQSYEPSNHSLSYLASLSPEEVYTLRKQATIAACNFLEASFTNEPFPTPEYIQANAQTAAATELQNHTPSYSRTQPAANLFCLIFYYFCYASGFLSPPIKSEDITDALNLYSNT